MKNFDFRVLMIGTLEGVPAEALAGERGVWSLNNLLENGVTHTKTAMRKSWLSY